MNTAEVPLHGPATTGTLSLPMCKGPRKVAAVGADLRLCRGQTNGGGGSRAALCGRCVRATVCVPSAVAYSLLLPESQVEIYLQVELRSPFYSSPAFRYFMPSSPNADSQNRLLLLCFQCSKISVMKVLESNLLLVLETEKK